MPISLKAASGGSGGIRLAAGQSIGANNGVGSVDISGLNINTTQTILSLTGKYRIQNLFLWGLGTTGNLTLSINIDGRPIYSGTVPITADVFALFGSTGSSKQSRESVVIENSLVITAQKTSTTASIDGAIYAEL